MFVNFNVDYLLFNLLYSDIAPFYTHFIRKHKPIDFKRFQISETVLWPIKTELYTFICLQFQEQIQEPCIVLSKALWM